MRTAASTADVLRACHRTYLPELHNGQDKYFVVVSETFSFLFTANVKLYVFLSPERINIMNIKLNVIEPWRVT